DRILKDDPAFGGPAAYGETFNSSLSQSPYIKKYGNGLGAEGAGAVDQWAGRASVLATPSENFSIYASYEMFDNRSPLAPQSVRGHEYTAYLSTPNVTNQKINTFRGEVKYDIPDLVSAKLTYGNEYYYHKILLDLDAGTSHYATFLPENGGAPIVSPFGIPEH